MSEPTPAGWRQLIPKEHGVWFMWLVPVALGAYLGGVAAVHALVAVAALLFHLASSAALDWLRARGRQGELARWAAGLGAAGGICMVPPVLQRPSLLVLGAVAAVIFLVNAAFARARLERWLVNDVLAIAGLQLWGPIAYALGGGPPGGAAWRLWAITTLFFVGTAFHVKTLFRERGNRRFKRLSNGAHLALLLAPWALGLPQVGLAYLPSALRAWLTPAGARLRPIVAGLIEIANSLVFLALAAILLSRAGLGA